MVRVRQMKQPKPSVFFAAFVMFLSLAFAFNVSSIAQEDGAETVEEGDAETVEEVDAEVEPPQRTAKRVKSTPSTNHVFIIFTDSSPDQIIVLDENGKWMPDIRSMSINMTIGEQPTCTCTMWSGFYKPTNPAKETWPLKQARSATPEEFQQMIDKLQRDPSALAY